MAGRTTTPNGAAPVPAPSPAARTPPRPGGGTPQPRAPPGARRRRAVAIADNLANTAENLALDWLLGVGTPTRPTTPLKVALVTTNGDDTTAGTEATGGTYTRQDLSVAASVAGTTSNSADLVFTDMPAATIVGVEIWDSATSPVRLWYGPLTATRTLAAGDELKLPAGALTLTIA